MRQVDRDSVMNKSGSELADRLVSQGIDNNVFAAAKRFHPILSSHLDEIVGKLARHTQTVDGLKDVVKDSVASGDFQKQLKSHWLELFSGKLDEGYYQRCQELGRHQSQIGMRPRWLMGNYAFLQTEFQNLALKKFRFRPNALGDVLDAITRLVFFDLNLRLSVYFALAEEAAVERRNEALVTLRGQFEKDVQNEIKRIGEIVSSINPVADSMMEVAERTNRQSNRSVDTADEVSSNINSISAAVSQLSSSISEIGRTVSTSASIAERAVQESERTDAQVQTLAEATERIGEVVKLITEIAEQTNLLALNATIEAARAGEAGKGFAVVANEVKNLANQTASATEDIATQISNIQDVTNGTVKAIQEISSTVQEISQNAAVIATAVHQQDAATDQIQQNIGGAVDGTNRISQDLGTVNSMAGDTRQSSESLSQQAKSLAEATQILHDAAQRFMDDLA